MAGIETLLPGDRVMTYKALLFAHPVVYVGYGMFVEKTKSGLVRLRQSSTFPQGQNFRVVYRPAPHEASVVVRRALARLGQEEYDLFRANCQHFINEVYRGQSRSEQVQGVTAVAVIAGLLWFLGAAFGG